ncbi:hypothetical protein CEXT_302541 [Caerostris extrusa]|uniref:Uncharacterized protein n=1 Tax=Caerostris extrusa TaxID=172846 RepID=A0AAV4MAT3_CAEEX|nr:hypothetical protein CEXT_302541 [Caerostris extrusa]
MKFNAALNAFTYNYFKPEGDLLQNHEFRFKNLLKWQWVNSSAIPNCSRLSPPTKPPLEHAKGREIFSKGNQNRLNKGTRRGWKECRKSEFQFLAMRVDKLSRVLSQILKSNVAVVMVSGTIPLH